MSKNPFANMGNLLKQAQEMQSKMGKIQEGSCHQNSGSIDGWGYGDCSSQWSHANYQHFD